MMIVVECGTCGRRSGAKDEWVGRRVKCPGCGQLVEIPPPAAPLAPAPPPQARPVQARPLQARPVQARPARPPQSPPQYASAAPAPEFAQPAAGSILDLLGDQSASGAAGPLGGQFGNPLGPPPTRRRGKSNSNKTVWFIIAGAGFAMALCGGIIVAILVPALQAARVAAQRAQFQPGQAPGRPAASGGWFGGSSPAAPSGPVWTPDARLLSQLPVDATFDRYVMKLPAGFASAPAPATPAPPGGRLQNYMWLGQPQFNATRQVVVAAVADMNSVPRSSPNDLDQALQGAMKQLRIASGIVGFTNTSGERGQLAGKQFIRAKFSGSINGVPINGNLLIMIEGARLVSLSGMCSDNPGTPDYELLNAALLSFKQR